MAWPPAIATADISITNVDSGSDSPASARTDIKTNFDLINNIKATLNQIIAYGEYVPKAGGSFTGNISIPDPTSNLHAVNLKSTRVIPDFPISPLAIVSGSSSLTLTPANYGSQVITVANGAICAITLDPTGCVHGQKIVIEFINSPSGGGYIYFTGTTPVNYSGKFARYKSKVNIAEFIYNSVTGTWDGYVRQSGTQSNIVTPADGFGVIGGTTTGSTITYLGTPSFEWWYSLGVIHFRLYISWTNHNGTGPINIQGLPELVQSSAAVTTFWDMKADGAVGATVYNSCKLRSGTTLQGSLALLDANGNAINMAVSGYISCYGSFPMY